LWRATVPPSRILTKSEEAGCLSSLTTAQNLKDQSKESITPLEKENQASYVFKEHFSSK
jgi:hypothetical protein